MLRRCFYSLALVAIVAAPGCKQRERPNVVVIVVDTLRPDRLSGFGHSRETTPRLDAFMEEAVVFENVGATSSQTVPSTASLLTGLYPSETSVQYYGDKSSFDGVHPWSEVGPYVDPSLTLLSERMHERGYETAAIVSNPWVRKDFGFGQGFESFVAIDCGDLCDGSDVVDDAIGFLEQRDTSRPFFLYLHFMDAHSPYSKRGITEEMYVSERGVDHYRNGPTPEATQADLDYMRDLYDEGVRRVDGHIGRLFDELDAFSLKDETLVVVTSDHGDEFDEHGGLGHGTTLYQELVASFVVMRYPKALSPKRVDTPVSLIDLAPTVIELVDSEPSARSLLRRPGDDGDTDRWFIAELGPIKSVRRGEWKLIYDIENGEAELYHLATDEAEANNLAAMNPKITQEMMRYLSRFIAGANGPSPSAPNAAVDEALREKLRAIGYIE